MIKEKKKVQLRHEYKHIINQADDLELSHRLSKIFKKDKHADSHGTYRVSSLYFDTPYDLALRQKVDGVNKREKFRIRYYNDDLSFIRLEKKFKVNGLCGKYHARLDKEEVEEILKGNYDFLKEKDNPLCLEFYSKLKGQLLRPKTIVIYWREAYIFDPANVRITLDRHLKTSLQTSSFLNPDLYLMDTSDHYRVLEVKYDEFLPEIVKNAVALKNRRASAYSKYAICRRFD